MFFELLVLLFEHSSFIELTLTFYDSLFVRYRCLLFDIDIEHTLKRAVFSSIAWVINQRYHLFLSLTPKMSSLDLRYLLYNCRCWHRWTKLLNDIVTIIDFSCFFELSSLIYSSLALSLLTLPLLRTVLTSLRSTNSILWTSLDR